VTKVLVADDHPVTRKILDRTLRKNGYQVVTAEDGLQAWDLLSGESDLRLAILDWTMPGMDGPEICRKLQEQRKFSLVYVVLLTAKEGTDNITQALRAGADDYITKPFEKEELLARLQVGERIVALQSQLIQAQKLDAIGQLAAGIAHEINTPAQYLADNTRFLQKAFDDVDKILAKYDRLLDMNKTEPASARIAAELETLSQEIDLPYIIKEIPQAIQQSLEGIGHISGIVQAMRDFARPGAKEKATADLNKAVRNTITVTASRWKCVAEMKTDFDPDLPPVSCFPAEINQVILNLIANAADAVAQIVGDGSKAKGTITISTRADGNWVEIRVSDTGCGIPENIRHKILDPFFTTKDVGQGTGQGLAVAHAIVVAKHAGTFTFETETGHGTTFILRLPVNPAPTKTEKQMLK